MVLILGLVIGYFAGGSSNNYRGMMSSGMMSGQGHMMKAMGDMNDMMGRLSDEEFEEVFLKQMIVHHEGAIEMSEALLKKTDRPELIKLGNDIISAQTSEIEMMEQWLKDWF